MSGVGLRPPVQVMQPAWMGAARLTRYSFSRMLIRRAFGDRWQIALTVADLDEGGRGEVRFEVEVGDHRFTFVAFTTTIDESEHTDRVIAPGWEITAALVEGHLDVEFADELRREVPRQEEGRFDQRVLVLTRGNRSVRFFDYLVGALAQGRQPDPEVVGDAGYIMRSTAFYGNGAFGMRSFADFPPAHPLGVPYRAQFLAAWLFRELSYVVVEHCARAKGGTTAVRFGAGWASFFGLGNATGLGLVPYAFKHPAVLDAWVGVRERALSEVRVQPGDAERNDVLRWWIARVRDHFASMPDDDRTPFFNGAQVHRAACDVAEAFEGCADAPRPYDELYRWAEGQHPETAELVVSLLIELHGTIAALAVASDEAGDETGDEIDELVDRQLVVDETAIIDPATTVAELRTRIAQWYPWLDTLALDDTSDTANTAVSDAEWYWWLITDNTNEPRRAPRAVLAPEGRDVPVDIALRLRRFAAALGERPGEESVQALLTEQPDHRLAADRLARRFAYGEPIDNACSRDYLPLMVQRFQLAMYGMDNFAPKSTDWLRVTLFQGAPRIADLAATDGSPLHSIDRWVWPPRPTNPRSTR